jgi:alpha-tubulin suppressor-like RCC1 family protein
VRPPRESRRAESARGDSISTPWRRRTRLRVVVASLLVLAPVVAVLGTELPSSAVSTGPVYVWGGNDNGQAGIGTTGTETQPVAAELPGNVAAGSDYSLALTSTGSIYAWGTNNEGQLGNGTTTQSTTPVQVQLPSGVTATSIAAGYETSYAVTSTGAVYAWGLNLEGQFGNGLTTNSSVPLAVTMPAAVTQIAAGLDSAYALTTAGKVYAWGNDFDGQLGNGSDGTSTNQLTPVQVALPSGVVATQIGAGASVGMAVSSSGTAYWWGYVGGAEASSGLPTVPPSAADTPQAVALPGGVLASGVSAGEADAYVLGQNGQVYGWGDNGIGELGNGTTTSSTSPVEALLPSGQTIASISAGGTFVLGVTGSGLVFSWGGNQQD